MPNRLKEQNSQYLKSHSDNPVNWWSWCDEAFQTAKEQGMLVLVSIGYSSCHWCHVMEKESFSDEYCASIMNKYFVSIKVDREERPDIDQIFMETAQMFNGHGGWPLNVICLPDGRPFFAGTYFPPKDNGSGIIPWPQLLMRIVDHYKRKPQELVENAENVMHNLAHANNPGAGKPVPFHNNSLTGLAKGLCQMHDDKWGGFSKAPKFPPHLLLEFLLAYRVSASAESDVNQYERLNEVMEKSLDAVTHGAIFDQLGGGFMRYCVDEFWLVPHFEKMLYDNGSMLSVLAKAYHGQRKPIYKAAIEETVSWLNKEMAIDGIPLYAASVDADSDGSEGTYYIWDPQEVKNILGDNAGKQLCQLYNITAEGTFEEGKSTPALTSGVFEERENAHTLRELLHKEQQLRSKPSRDSKILLFWNALVAQGLVDAGIAIGSEDFIRRAQTILDWIWEHMCSDKGIFSSHYYDGVGAQGIGYLDDYAAYAQACLNLARVLDVYDFGSSKDYIERAQEVVTKVEELFVDKDHAGYFYTQKDLKGELVRKKYWLDNATPSGNAMMLHALGQLYSLTGESVYQERFNRLQEGFAPLSVKGGTSITYAMAGIAEKAIGIPIVKANSQEALATLEMALRNKRHRTVFLLAAESNSQKQLYELCVGEQCFPGTEDFEEILEKL